MKSGNRRQIALFLVVLVVPCLVLIGLGIRLGQQERELGQKRQADERQRLLAAFRSGLLGSLDAIRSDEVSVGLEPGQRYRHPETAFAGWVEEGRLVLPWEADEAARRAQHLLSRPEIRPALEECEQLEAAPHRAADAAHCYQRLLPQLRHPVAFAYVRLQMAGALHAAGRRSQAAAIYREMLSAPPGITDQDGIPLCLFAGQRLPLSGGELALAAGAVKAVLESRPWTGPLACELLRETADRMASIDAAAAGGLRAAVSQRVQVVKQAQSLQDDFERLGFARSGSAWTAYGEEPWLVTIRKNDAGRPSVLVVRASEIAAPLASRFGVRIAAAHATESEPAGEALAGLRVVLPPFTRSAESGHEALQRWLYISALLLVVATAGFAAYLLWRDMRREMLLADLRAQFVASVSHELKTPLTAIRMFAETLQMKRSRDAATEAEYLETIVAECERLSRLVDGVLLFAKTEQGKKVYHFHPVHLSNVVQAAARAMQYPLDRQGFRLEMSVDDTIPPVTADADAIEQALLNLVGNAMKYSADSREIELQLARENGHAVLRVTDHGVGIAPEVQSRIFDKFYRAPTRENELTPGTGLGLALVAQIAKAHGGRVDVRSALGKGSTFSLSLPLEVKT